MSDNSSSLARAEPGDACTAEALLPLVYEGFFDGLTHAEVAKVLGVSEPTVKRHWDFARAWLLREIRVLATGG